MSITVSDIESKEFKYKGNGYDPLDVDNFLDEICDEMEALAKRIASLESELEEARMAAAAQAARPQVVQEAPKPVSGLDAQALEEILVSAHRVSSETIANAQAKAQQIEEEAQRKADEALGTLERRKAELTERVASLRQTLSSYRQKALQALEEHRALLSQDVDDDEPDAAEQDE